ncbi:MAG: DUF2924 domain-containing protein [Hyphomicrobiaceae bacterium]|uniref:DUF2924 domain-containing protein n=1 Tax=Pseudorhodoplanes sp. TaxID=1934341 RepID=UPI003D0B0CF1
MKSDIDVAAIAAEIMQIRGMSIDRLRLRWRQTFGRTPPKGLTKDLLGRMIAYRIQEEAFGGLDRATAQLLDRLARDGKGGAEPTRRLKAGTILVREYRGERHTVTVVPDGYVWREQTYPSLSTIARAITGISWNGPRFFGLRMAKDTDGAAAPLKGTKPQRRKRVVKVPPKLDAAGRVVRRHVRATI